MTSCNVCWAPLGENSVVVLECGHILCESHADQVLVGEREPCPVCGGPGATKPHVVDPPESTVTVRSLEQ